MSATLLKGALISTVAAIVFMYLGVRLSQRVSQDRPFAGWAFVVWWFGVAIFILAWNAVTVYLVVAQAAALSTMVALRVVSYLALCTGVAALMVYLSYLFTGRRSWAVPLGLFYGGLFLSLVFLVLTHDPVGVDVRRWRVGLEYRSELGGAYYVLLSLLILPTSVGAVAYFTLRNKTKDAYMRFRIALVAVSIFVWGLSSLLARLAEHDLWQVFTRSGIGLLAALVILFAYETPETIRSRFTTKPVDEVVEAFHEEQYSRRETRRREYEAGLRDRMEDLV